jgi:hypothetical protein
MILLLLATIAGNQAGGQTEQLEFLRLACKANRDAFAFGTFRFEYTRGSSANAKDAAAGVFSKAVREAGFYAFDGKNARYELIADPKGLATVTTRVNDRISSSLASTFRALTDGEATLLDFLRLDESNTALIHDNAEVYPGPSLFYGSARYQFPLLLGSDEPRAFDLLHNLNEIKNGKSSVAELDFDSDLDGLKVCKLSLRYQGGKCTYWIDVNRGCVALRMFNRFDHGAESVHTFSELEHLPNAGWLPRRRLCVLRDGEVVDRLVVLQADTVNKPQASVFQLEFPEPVVLVDRTKRLVSSPRKTWSLLDRPGPGSPGTRAFPQAR